MPAGTLRGGNRANLDWGSSAPAVECSTWISSQEEYSRLFNSTGTPELLVMVSLMYMASPLRNVFFSGTTFT